MIQVAKEECVRPRSPLASCRACVTSCGGGAITALGRAPRVAAGCDDCGVCVPACPTGALRRDPPLSASDARPGRDGAVVLACEVCASAGDARVPCLAGLSVVELAARLRAEPDLRLRLVRGDCAACRRRAGGAVAALATRLRAVGRALGLGEGRLAVEERPGARVPAAPAATGVSRRAIFGALQRAVAAASARSDAVPRPRREVVALLRAQVAELPAEAGLVFRFSPPAGCDGCAVCVSLCPPRALAAVDDGAARTLTLSAARCVGCGLCVDVCGHPGARLRAVAAPPGSVAAGAPAIELVRLRALACTDCGLPVYAREDARRTCFVCDAQASRAGSSVSTR